MQFFIKDFFNKCDQVRSFLDFVIFTQEILNSKLHFLYSEISFLCTLVGSEIVSQ